MRKKQMKYIFNKHNTLVLVFFLFSKLLLAQGIEKERIELPKDTVDQKSTRVKLVRSNRIFFDQNRLPDVQIIYGDVKFQHDSAYMYCDSAYFYTKESSFDAFGNVHIEEGDSVSIYGDFLYYDGNTRLARLRRNVRMETQTSTLTTENLNYDRTADLAYYYTGGTLKDETNTLTSIWGQYSNTTKKALFKDSVVLVNESFILRNDSLAYDTETHVADIVSETHIFSKDTTNIYTHSGWYDTEQDRAMLLERSLVVRPNGLTLVGDTLFYDKRKQTVEAFSKVEMNDTLNRATLLANYAFYDEVKESGLACDSLLLIDWSSPDSLFLHADTLYIEKDSSYNVLRAYQNVRFYREDMQGVGDSLVYLSRDSVGTLYGQPVVWSEEMQLSGSIIQVFLKNSEVDYFFIPEKAKSVQPAIDKYFNQMAGKEMKAYVRDGGLNLVELKGNCQTIYCPMEELDSVVIGVNKTESSYINLFFKEDRTIDRIVLPGAAEGKMIPVNKISGNDLYIDQFFWIEEQRPKKKEDVFLSFPTNRHESSVSHTMSASSSGDDSSGE